MDDANNSLDNWMDTAIETMASLSALYIKQNELKRGKTDVLEMDRIETEYSTASEAARDYLDSRDDRSSVGTSCRLISCTK